MSSSYGEAAGKGQSMQAELLALVSEAGTYFDDVVATSSNTPPRNSGYWEQMSPDQQARAVELRRELSEIGVRFIQNAKASPLINEVDLTDMRFYFRRMAAALRILSYEYQESYAISEEDRVYGVQPAEQNERLALPTEARKTFARNAEYLLDKLDFFASLAGRTISEVPSSTPLHQYRPATAFIMMQIDCDIPRLEDVKNCIRDCFRRFGIQALRSDEIEHEDVITQRILDEIATAEFLIADLTGSRPSVYYEVGYAHALRRRPFLYREKGTPLHFDLAVHNVPEYENITDLKRRLEARLTAVTGKEPKRD